MRKLDIVRAWKDEDYRMSLSEGERRMLPTNPAGLIEISDSELGAVGGGEAGGGTRFICSLFGDCQSGWYQVCSGDWMACTFGPYFCPILPPINN